MTLHETIQRTLKQQDIYSLIQKMGYQDTVKPLQRIHNLLEDPELGLDDSNYDFKYSSQEFLVKLCESAGLSERSYLPNINSIKSEIKRRRSSFKSYVFIDTEFKRTTESIIAIACMQANQYFSLDYSIRKRPKSEQLSHVLKFINTHYQESSGRLPLFGGIKRYWFYYENNKAYKISTDGIVLPAQVPPCLSGSKIRL